MAQHSPTKEEKVATKHETAQKPTCLRGRLETAGGRSQRQQQQDKSVETCRGDSSRNASLLSLDPDMTFHARFAAMQLQHIHGKECFQSTQGGGKEVLGQAADS